VQFQDVFGGPVSAENVAAAIAAFERTVLSGNAPYDRFKAGDSSALSPEAQRGMKVFFSPKAHCSACHVGPNFTDGGFHNLGVGITAEKPDLGRMEVSKQLGDRGAFKTPTLREIARTAPYMHDGSLATLEEVIEYYDKGGIPNPQLDEEIFPLKLTDQEKQDLVTFLKEGLSSPDYPLIRPPKLPE
jgi:cytochrome c peroxidase